MLSRILASIILASVLPLAGLTAQQFPAEPTLVVENGRVVVGDGKVLERGTVVVAGKRIVSVTEEPVEAPDARRIDASGKTVLPGLIDGHVHLTVPPKGRDSLSVVEYLENDLPRFLQSMLEAGVTMVRSMGEYWPWARRLRQDVSDGSLPGPRIVTPGPLFTKAGGHPAGTVCSGFFSGEASEAPDPFCRSHLAREVTKPDEARAAVRQLGVADVDFIKVVSDSLLTPVQIEDEIVEAIIDQTHREGLRAVGHVALDEDMVRYARMGMDGFAHLPREAPSKHQPERLTRVLAKYGTPVTTTIAAGLPNAPVGRVLRGDSPRRETLETRSKHAARLSEAGVPIVVGSDWNPIWRVQTDHPAMQAGAAMVTEMKMLRWGGISRHAIIQAATSDAAKALEMEDQIGTLEAGKLADLIVVDGNPLEDLSALRDVEVVVKGGEVVVGQAAEEGAAASPGTRQGWSRAQRQVWQREKVYWEAVEAGDVERFMPLWDERFVGWPAGAEAPVRRSDLREEVETWFAEVRSRGFDYDLTPMSVTVYDDVAVTFHRARSVYGDSAEEGHTEVGRLTHVWRKRDGTWTIIGGMSAPADTGEPNR